MAGDQRILKQDGYLNIATESCNITYHPNLNVILVFNAKNEVKVLDVHSGVILQASTLPGNLKNVSGRYMPMQEKILFCNGENLGLRGDYNGVLLLDTILQSPIVQNDDVIRLELLLSEAVIFLNSLHNLVENGLECQTDVSNELLEKIREAQGNTKKGIKAHKWNTICLELPYSSLKYVSSNVVEQLKRLDRHIPALAIASAINERLTDLLAGSRIVDKNNYQRCQMYSEAARRQTFEKWPHMDYKWALPDQMAQAGFYHQPSISGEDRALCFTCNVCLVCWEKTDEPWSEHERHSPNCPFVKGEYTQNVPLSVTYASDPAVKTSGIDVISNSDYSHVLCTSSSESGDVTVWSIERQLKKLHTFNIADVAKNIYSSYDSVEVTAMCVLTNRIKHKNHQNSFNKKVKLTFKDNIIGSKIILGLSVVKDNKINLNLVVLNIETKVDDCAHTQNNNETIVCDRDEEKMFFKKTDENFDNSFMGGFINLKFNDSDKHIDYNNACTMVNYDFLKDDLPNSQDTNEESMLVATKLTEDTSDSNEKMNTSHNSSHYEEIDCSVQSYTAIISDNFKIDEIIPTSSAGKQILVKLLKLNNKDTLETADNEPTIEAKLLLYPCDDFGDIGKDCEASTTFNALKSPKEICVLPTPEKHDRKINDDDFEAGAFCVVSKDGTIRLLSLHTFELITKIEVPNERFVSVVYCKTLDRICGCTESGSLIFYSLHDVDNESEDDIIDENLVASDNSITGTEQEVTETDGLQKQNLLSGTSATNPSIGSDQQSSLILLAHKSDLTVADLKLLYSLTLFDEMLTPYAAEVPTCWNELVQAQKQRRHPQHLRPGDDTHLTKTWRLHNDATTWDEHLIELNLAKTPSLGHIDLKFSLYQQCPNPPAIQVTLLKQNTSGFGYRMKGPSSVSFGSIESVVDETIDFSLTNQHIGITENPVLTEEYLQAQNADILAGPIELSSCMDICDQGGVVALTSPKLFKTRSRNFLLHIKTMVDPAKEGQSKTRVPVKKKGVMRFLISSLAHSSSQNSANTTSFSQNSSSTKQSRNNFYIGCDWLHEISITIRSTKKNPRVTNERAQRIAMLDSNNFVENLLTIICNSASSALKKNLALDILIWICTIRLNRFRSPKTEKAKTRSTNDNTNKQSTNNSNSGEALSGDMLDQQKEFVRIVEKFLEDFLSNCIIMADRTLAHKCVKLIFLLTEGVRNLPIDVQTTVTFDNSLKEAIIKCIPALPLSKHSSAIRWFTLLVCSTSTSESHSKISEMCVQKLMDVTKEMDKRWDPYCSLLGTRFGLYGFPFEPELFDMELPSTYKNNTSTPNSLVNIIRSSAGLSQTFGLDLKKLSSIDGVDFRSFPHLIKSKGVSNQIRGLLEVEPLHFTCFSASEATRIENVDSVTSSSSSNINMDDIIVTPMQTWGGQTDGKKDSEKDNFQDDIMNNVKNMMADGHIQLVSNGKKHKIKDDIFEAELDNVIKQFYDISSPVEDKVYVKCPKFPKFKTICQYIKCCDENSNTFIENSDESVTSNKAIQKHLNGHKNDDNMTVFPWHKHLTAPPKQMVVVERIHSGARRFIVLDFGTPILLTDLVIPACDELASIFIDIWCFEEETDSVRLVETQDIGQKTLILSDLQPPPISRYMKITIIGRYGMSATRCKIPIGNFYGHIVVLDSDGYGDPLLQYMKHQPANVQAQIKALNCLYEDVHCRYSLSSSKLMELLTPVLNCEMSNVAHMQAFIYKQRDDEFAIDHSKIVTTYEECILLQHQINIIKNVLSRLDTSLNQQSTKIPKNILQTASRDKLRVLSQNLIEILLHFSMEYGLKNIFALHIHFNMEVANTLFNSLVVSGDAHIQLATCSLLVRMCCFQPWWGDFLADIFCNLFSSQNSKIFPQDRIFYLLTYLGRRSIAMGTCRTIVIDAILKTLAKLLAPISPHYQAGENPSQTGRSHTTGLWSKSDLQLITWLLLFLSVCLDDSNDKKNKASNRWDFMSCESDFTKSRSHSNSSTGKQMRCLKKRILQQTKYNCNPQYNDLTKKFYIMQNELPEIFMELTGKPKPKSSKTSTTPKTTKEPSPEVENNFDKGLKSIKVSKLLIVIRGLVSLLLEMDFTCNMDLFLLTCKVIARLVSVCKPSVQIYKIITTNQLEQLIRLAVWNDQQQPWAVHAITCLLQDLLNKNIEHPFEVESTSSDVRMEPESEEIVFMESSAKYAQLPSLIECEDNESDDFFSEIDIVDRGKNLAKKDSLTQNKNSFNYFCKGVSNGMDARLEFGLDTNVEISITKLTMVSSMDLYASLPQISEAEVINGKAELENWPQYVMNIWSGPEYNNVQRAYQMLKNVFDNILSDLQLPDTWVHLEQVLQIWLTLNSELSKNPYNLGITSKNVPKIQLSSDAVKGLILALTWHGNIKLHSWCLGFQCLILACNSTVPNDSPTVAEIIVKDDYFEKMLLRFFSGYGMSSSVITNRCAGPTICKYLHEFLSRLQNKTWDVEKKLKQTLLNVVLQLVQPGGAITNQLGPIDAQSQLVGDLLQLQYDKADLSVSLSIIESISYLAYNNISSVDKVQCQRSSDVNNSSKTFGSLFATVLGADNSKQNTSVSDNSLIISLLILSSSLIQTELSKCDIQTIPENEVTIESQTDETKAEKLIIDNNKSKALCVADTVLQHFETMKRLLGSLSNCSSSSFTLMAQTSLYSMKPTESTFFLNEPETTADAVFNMLMLLSEKATSPNLVVAPIFQYLESGSTSRNVLPRLQLSEPFLWYILKVLEIPEAVNIFTNMGGIQILCKNLVLSNKVLVNMQPGLISLIMQHMTKNTKLKLHTYMNTSGSSKKSCQNQKIQDGMINFAPFCSITSENSTAQSSDVLIQTPIASHRRARTPAWSYMFYPNESHVDLTITLPTAILLKEIQLQPHLPTLSSCPSAVAIEISRDYGLGPISFGQPLTTTGMTCIRLKLSKAEIATSIVLRLYRPKDSASIGLTQIAVLGNTIFSINRIFGNEMLVDDDTLAKTSVGWIRILSRCFTVATIIPECKLSKAVIGAASEYPGFLEACCSLMNVVPLIPQACLQNLETVLLKLGAYSRDLCVSLIKNLLWGTTPQTYRLSNEAICDLLFELCTTNDSYLYDKVVVLLEWVVGLQQNFSNRTIRCTNPQSGFVKCIASILWTIYTEICITKLPDMLGEVFETCLYWIDLLENDDPLKTSFDSLLCSLCCIKPDLFNELLKKADVSLMNNEQSEINIVHDETKGITDDNKEASGSEWFKNVAAQNLSTLLVKPSYLATLAMACQSPLAIYQLVDSGLPKLLAHALFEYCCSLSPEIHKMSLKSQNSQSNSSYSSSSSNCLTDADKEETYQSDDTINNDSLININHVPKILDFFSECCSEGHMRDWLGSYQGSIFWKPLLELLCNYRPIVVGEDEPMQQSFICMERSTINFFSRVTSCHPKNQDYLTIILISVIKNPQSVPIPKKTIISGFTRRIVLQLLLENERILVSVRSKMPLLKKETSINLVNNHPSKRVNSRHLLFYVGSHTKCQDILQNCISVYSNIFPSMHSESQQSDSCGSIQSSSGNQSEGKTDDGAFQVKLDFNGSPFKGMEYLSVAAGVTAKDKRLKDVKNQAAVLLEFKDFIPKFSKMFNRDDLLSSSNTSSINNTAQLIHPDIPEVVLTSDTTISQILATLYSKKHSLSTPCITLNLLHHGKNNDEFDETLIKAVNMEPLPSPLQRFSSRGGLSLLAHYLPIVYPENTKPVTNNPVEKEKPSPSNEWIKLEQNDEIYEDLEDVIEPSLKNQPITSVPQHSLAAFGLFLRLPAYSDVLLRDKLRAQCLLRLVLGVTGDGEGNDIYSLALAPSLPTLPFEVFRQLLDSSLLTTDDGVLLRRMVIEVGAIHLVLNCLGIFTHQSQNGVLPELINNTKPPPLSPTASTTSPNVNSPLTTANNVNAANVQTEPVSSDDKSHMYWAKGTGFGTGSTQQSWNVEQALMRQKSEEEHVTVLLQVLSSYINPDDKIPSSVVCDDIMSYHDICDVNGELPPLFLDLLQKSCLIPALCSYLRNDSVLDITRHIPLYRAILQLLRAISLSYQLVSLLQPQDNNDRSPSICELLVNMKTCVDTYAKRLKVNKKSNIKGQTQKVTVNIDDGDDEGLALLIPDIHETTILVQKSTNTDALLNQHRDQDGCSTFDGPLSKSIEQRYLEVMKALQFDTFDMIVEAENGYRFAVSHHFENNVRLAGDRYHPSRVKRLAQETVTLSTSLPLSYSSSVFVRCDTDRLDIMKVLITGPADTPYANGCFEFDVFFPPDYPNSPMLINLETTGRHSVRFNPNLYNDGKVCLSVLNTWHGRPEEKWNAQASSFLQVLVSIQSLILVPEPYFNEPGFERSRGTPSGTYSSREYNSNIYQSCVRWAMLEQIKKPNPCFKDVIHTHFWLKRNEICTQIENWIEELSKPQYNERSGRTISFNSMVLRRQYRQLREELSKLKVPDGLEDLDMPFNPNVTLPVMTEIVTPTPVQSGSTTSFTYSSTTSNDSSTPTSVAQPSQPILENPDDSESDVEPLENSDLHPDTSSEIVTLMEDTNNSINYVDI